MCGIVGALSHNQGMCDPSIIRGMVNEVRHRGPNSTGVWVSEVGLVALGHTRLSILDLTESGSQPMHSDSKRYALSFNGEIYNHCAIRQELEINWPTTKRWVGRSDSETLLSAVELWGLEKTLEKINGMFAIALWDNQECKLQLARDRFGEKPLYYGCQGGEDNLAFIFGSELKALKKHPSFNSQLNHISINEFIKYGFISSPKTIYNSVNILEPGCLITVLLKDLTVIHSRYWDAIEVAKRSKLDVQLNSVSSYSQIKKEIENSVSSMMISDVNVGSFLSGGIDSSLITAIMKRESSKKIETFTAGFAEKKYDESQYAKDVAGAIGVSNHNLLIDAEMALKVIDAIPEIYDEPFADSSQIPAFLVSKLAAEYVQVALTGDGGDELFGGYNRHVQGASLYKKMACFPQFLRALISQLILSVDERGFSNVANLLNINTHNFGNKAHKFAISMKCNSFLEYYESLLAEDYLGNDIVIKPNASNEMLENFNQFSISEKLMLVDTVFYLPNDILAKIDRASMANSLETRAPFLGREVYECAWKLPHELKIKNGKSKWVLRQLLSDYLPKSLIERPKMGFGIPLDEWLRGPLKNWAESILNKNKIEAAGLLSFSGIQRLWLEHQSHKKNHQKKLWNILMFQLWYERNFS